MRIIIMCVLLLSVGVESFGQLVRRKDYDAAFAIQAGGDISMLAPWGKPGVSVRPTGGLKMTFPFTRKWFMGGEVNYSELKFKSDYNWELGKATDSRFNIRQIQVPVYLKYMLNCNRASVLFGVYGAYFFDKSLSIAPSDAAIVDAEKSLDDWTGGVVVGYEHQIVKHLNVILKINAGVKELMKNGSVLGKKLYPVQASLTLSFDILRIGDCECD